MIRKVAFGVVGAIAALVVTGGSAFAFECYNASRSDTGNAQAGGSEALMSLEEILAEPEIVGLCPAGVDHVIAGLEEEGFRTDVLINFHALMAGGLERNGKGEEKLDDGQAIDHLSEEFFATADELIGAGFGLCV